MKNRVPVGLGVSSFITMWTLISYFLNSFSFLWRLCLVDVIALVYSRTPKDLYGTTIPTYRCFSPVEDTGTADVCKNSSSEGAIVVVVVDVRADRPVPILRPFPRLPVAFFPAPRPTFRPPPLCTSFQAGPPLTTTTIKMFRRNTTVFMVTPRGCTAIEITTSKNLNFQTCVSFYENFKSEMHNVNESCLQRFRQRICKISCLWIFESWLRELGGSARRAHLSFVTVIRACRVKWYNWRSASVCNAELRRPPCSVLRTSNGFFKLPCGKIIQSITFLLTGLRLRDRRPSGLNRCLKKGYLLTSSFGAW